MLRHRLADERRDVIKDVFPPPKKMGRPERNRRDMIDGIPWILRTGAPWRNLAEDFGPWSAVWDLLDEFNADGALGERFGDLVAAVTAVQFGMHLPDAASNTGVPLVARIRRSIERIVVARRRNAEHVAHQGDRK